MDLNYTRTELAIMREERRQQDEWEAAEEEFGVDWEERAADPEERRFIPENDVEDAEEYGVQSGYGWARLVPPANG